MMINDSTAKQLAPESDPKPSRPQQYCLQHSEQELRRLETQGNFLRASTRDFLERTGITEGMRVLDMGCGAGDVSFLTAELVGPAGEVIGVDRAEAAIGTANARAQAKGLTNVHFVQADFDHLDQLAAERPFDAVVCRLVLVHQANAYDAIRKLLRLVRPGGVVGFQELDLGVRYWSTHKLNALDKFYACVQSLLDRKLCSDSLSTAFVKAFDDAGITNRRIIRSGAAESSSEVGVYTWLGDWVRSFSGTAVKLGLPLPDFGSKPFDELLKSEVESTGAVFIPFFWLGAVGRLPCVRAVEN